MTPFIWFILFVLCVHFATQRTRKKKSKPLTKRQKEELTLKIEKMKRKLEKYDEME